MNKGENTDKNKRNLLLVVDMQNIYLEGELWACRNTDKVAAGIERILQEKKVNEVIFTTFKAPEKPVGTWKEYNYKYSSINSDMRLNELIDTLKGYTEKSQELFPGNSQENSLGKFPVYSKSTYSSYSIPQVQEAVSRADRVAVCGVVAECCILATVESLIDAGAKIIYLKDAIAGQTRELEKATEKIVKGFSTLHTEIMTVEEYLKSI